MQGKVTLGRQANKGQKLSIRVPSLQAVLSPFGPLLADSYGERQSIHPLPISEPGFRCTGRAFQQVFERST